MIYGGLAALAVSLVCYLGVSSAWGLALPAVFAGVAHAVLYPASTAQGSSTFPSRYRGLGTTLMLATLDLGTLCGAPLIGFTLDYSADGRAAPLRDDVRGSGHRRGRLWHVLRLHPSKTDPMSDDPRDRYRRDLASIHDAGFGAFAATAAPWLVELLRGRGLSEGTVVDLGSGSGILAEALVAAAYRVVGFDISASMVELARRRVPRAEFRQASFLEAPLPECVAVTAIGEVFNYLFDTANTPRRLEQFFRRVYEALTPGGLLVFDVATPGRVAEGIRRGFTEGDGWACLYEAEEDRHGRTLERRITTFRRHGAAYRRDYEVHRLRLYDRKELATVLRQAGFRVRTVTAYGGPTFPPGYIGFIARKP